MNARRVLILLVWHPAAFLAGLIGGIVALEIALRILAGPGHTSVDVCSLAANPSGALLVIASFAGGFYIFSFLARPRPSRDANQAKTSSQLH